MLKRLLPALALLALTGNCAFRAEAQSPQGTSFNKGVAAYNQHNWGDAIKHFMDSAANENGGANAWLYIAHCYYGSAQRQKACETYKMVQDLYPNSPQAKIASQYAAKLRPVGTSGLSSVYSSTAGNTSSGNNSNNSSNNNSNNNNNATALQDRLEIVPPRAGRPPVSPMTIRTIKATIARLPAVAKNTITNCHIKMLVTPTIIDYAPQGEFREEPGFEGRTLKSCGGYYKNGVIVVAERSINELTNEILPPSNNEELERSLYYPVAAAIDVGLGNLSDTPEVKHAYELDRAKITEPQATTLRYYLLDDPVRRFRTCCELLAIRMGSRYSINEALLSAFPETMKVLRIKTGI